MMRALSDWLQRRFIGTELGSLALLLFFIILAFWLFGKLLAPVFVSVVFAYLMYGCVKQIEKLKCPHMLAVNLVFIVFLGVLVFALFFLVPLLWEQLSNLINELPFKIKQVEGYIDYLSQEYPAYISKDQINQWVSSFQTDFARMGQFALSFSIATISNVLMLVVYLVLVPLMVYFFVKDSNQILSWFALLLPPRRRLMKNVWVEVNEQIANYIRAKILELILVGIAATLAFFFFGLKYAVLLGVLVGLSVLVPYVGVVIVTIPVFVVAYFQWGLDINFFYLVVVYSIIMVIDGNILAPLLFAETMEIHPVAVIIAILIFGGLWGFWGVFFAVPLASVAKALLKAWFEPPKIEEQGVI